MAATKDMESVPGMKSHQLYFPESRLLRVTIMPCSYNICGPTLEWAQDHETEREFCSAQWHVLPSGEHLSCPGFSN